MTTSNTQQSFHGKPTPPPVDIENIPQELKDYPQWVCWKYELIGEKWKKPPYRVNGKRADKTNSDHWSDFAEAYAAYDDCESDFSGIGFCNSPGDPFGFIDLDDCLENGKLINGACGIVDLVDSYTEISPSGNGLRIIAKGKFKKDARKDNVELYSNSAYLTITGNSFDLFPRNIEHRQEELTTLFTQTNGKEKSKDSDGDWSNVELDRSELTQEDRDLCAKVMASQQGKDFSRLLSGDLSQYNGDHSAADQAIFNMLAFWTGKDSHQMSRIYLSSELSQRDKSKRDDYLQRTIHRSIIDTTEVYESSKKETSESIAGMTVDDVLGEFEMTNEYVDQLGQEQFLYDNLIIALHILTIIAMSGGGKTTFMYYHVAPKLADEGYKVWYIDADSPASDHKKMKEVADKHGFRLLNPDINRGTNTDKLLKKLVAIANSQTDLTDFVFFFDTLKKFADLLNKGSIKEFFILARKLTTLGATVVLLGHANKYRDGDGNLVFEGVGDVKSDSDELIYFESKPAGIDGIDVTTVVDTSKGAKVRGIFNSFSFNISTSRDVTFYDKPLELVNDSNGQSPKATDVEILQAAEEYLSEIDEPVAQKPFAQHVADMTGTAYKRVRSLIVQMSGKKGTPKAIGKTFLYTIGDRNAHRYEFNNRLES